MNCDNDELKNEICDLLYHLIVLMVESALPLSDVVDVLEERRKKISNLKVMKVVDHNT